ncbi:MAG: hypothetical protein ACHBN1_20405 [Heteroscytonema crispum UTEX LB 1556]
MLVRAHLGALIFLAANSCDRTLHFATICGLQADIQSSVDAACKNAHYLPQTEEVEISQENEQRWRNVYS